MNVKILRSNPSERVKSYYKEYRVPIAIDGNYTIMDVLNYIFNNLDSTLSYYSHSACNQGICGRCGVKVNGKIKLACLCLADSDELTIEPKNNNILKDLITI